MKSSTISIGNTSPGHNWIRVFLGVAFQIAVCDSLISFGGAVGSDNSLGRQLLWGSIGASSLIYIITSQLSVRAPQFSFGGWPIWLLLIHAAASTTWSITPEVTLKRSILLLFLVTACGATVGSMPADKHQESFSKFFAPPMVFLVTISLILTAIAPNYTFTAIGWRGVSGTKNETGQMMAFSVLLILYGVYSAKLKKLAHALLLIAAVALLFQTRSTAALLGIIFAVTIVGVIATVSLMRRSQRWAVIVTTALLVTGATLFAAFQLQALPAFSEVYTDLLAKMGKSDNFTGRTSIWNIVLGESRYHDPLIGGGYGGFWAGRQSISGYALIGNNIYPGQAHNGYLDIYNDLGIIGLILLSATLIIAFYRNYQLAAMNHIEAKLHFSITLLCLFLNLGESTLLRTTQFMNIVFIASVIRTAALTSAHRIYGTAK